MGEAKKNGVTIIPMNDFWVDCYTTAIYSALLSFCNVDKRVIYRNSYEYVYDRNKKDMGRVYIKTDVNDYTDGFLVKNEKHEFSKDDDVIECLKGYLDQGKLVMLGIDMYYGVRETSQWHKHHIRHYVIAEKYEEENKKVAILETADEGYREYYLSYEEISKAAKGFEGYSDIYSIEADYCPDIYDIEQVKTFARKTCKSIDQILLHIDDIWHVDEKYLMAMSDEIEVHLKSMANRQRVNYLLVTGLGIDNEVEEVKRAFNQLEEEYYVLRKNVIKLCESKKYFENERRVKDKFVELLLMEKRAWNIWESITQNISVGGAHG